MRFLSRSCTTTGYASSFATASTRCTSSCFRLGHWPATVVAHTLQLEALTQEHLPDLFEHFKQQGVEIHMFASQWFLTLFAAKVRAARLLALM